MDNQGWTLRIDSHTPVLTISKDAGVSSWAEERRSGWRGSIELLIWKIDLWPCLCLGDFLRRDTLQFEVCMIYSHKESRPLPHTQLYHQDWFELNHLQMPIHVQFLHEDLKNGVHQRTIQRMIVHIGPIDRIWDIWVRSYQENDQSGRIECDQSNLDQFVRKYVDKLTRLVSLVVCFGPQEVVPIRETSHHRDQVYHHPQEVADLQSAW